MYRSWPLPPLPVLNSIPALIDVGSAVHGSDATQLPVDIAALQAEVTIGNSDSIRFVNVKRRRTGQLPSIGAPRHDKSAAQPSSI